MRLIVTVIFSLSAFIAPLYAQQETVAEFQALEWFTGRPDVLAMKIEKSRFEQVDRGSLFKSSVALERQSVGFVGVASFARINPHSSPPVLTRDADVVIPLDVIQRFLEMLLQSPIKDRIYSPSVPRTGGSQTQIEFDLETEAVTFFTWSLTEGGIPWGATFGGTHLRHRLRYSK